MSTLLIANILGIISNVLVFISPFFKTKKSILLTQVGDCVSGALAEILAKSYAPASLLVIGMIRNITMAKGLKDKRLYWLYSILCIVIGLATNNRGLIGLFPIIAVVQYTLWCAYTTSAQSVRCGMIINLLLWTIHEYFVQLYASAILCIAIIIVTAFNIYRYKNTEEIAREAV